MHTVCWYRPVGFTERLGKPSQEARKSREVSAAQRKSREVITAHRKPREGHYCAKKVAGGQYRTMEVAERPVPCKGSRGTDSTTQRKVAGGYYRARKAAERSLPQKESRGRSVPRNGGHGKSQEVSTAQMKSRVVGTAQWKLREGQNRAPEVTGRSVLCKQGCGRSLPHIGSRFSRAHWMPLAPEVSLPPHRTRPTSLSGPSPISDAS